MKELFTNNTKQIINKTSESSFISKIFMLFILAIINSIIINNILNNELNHLTNNDTYIKISNKNICKYTILTIIFILSLILYNTFIKKYI